MGNCKQNSGKKKVLFLLEAFDKGGIEKVTLDIVNHLNPELYDITVQTFWYGGSCQSQVRDSVKVLPFFLKKYVRGIIRLIALLPPKLLYTLFVRGHYDVEIGASDGGAAKVISGSTNPNSKKIAWIHMDVIERGSKLAEFKDAASARHIYDKFDTIACVSEACRDKFEQKFGKDYPICVKKNPIPTEEILQKSREPITLTKKPGVNFICVGRLEDQKGFDRLIRVSDRLVHQDHCVFHVCVIGAGSKKEALERQLRECHLEDTIEFLGFQSNPYPYLRQADAFLLTSRDEAFPLVVGESLVLGTPVVSTDCTGIREWIGDGEKGILMENSEEGIYAGMKKVLDNPKILEQYRGKNEISFEAALQEFEELLEV